MNSTLDGDFQRMTIESGAYIREHFFGPDPRLRALVAEMSDEELQALPRGGHDFRKIYAAYQAAVENTGAPTAILAKTVKGWKLGPEIEARNATHQIKKMTHDQLRALRERLKLQNQVPDPVLDSDEPPYIRPEEGSPEYEYLTARLREQGGPLPHRVVRGKGLEGLPAPDDAAFAEFRVGSRDQAVSTTMVFARVLRNLMRDQNVGRFVVPIIPDEGRTFGLDALFSEMKIYSPKGQLYTPVDAGLPMHYAEAVDGQILEEGITEAGGMASFMAAGTSYATWSLPMLPFYMYYSMFGFQRVGDEIWQLADERARGFLIGCTAGRTTMNGEGLQHEDGQSHVLASTLPNVRAYDPSFAYEVAAIVKDGINVMYGPNAEDVFYYLTVYNENYPMPALPEGEEGQRVIDGALRGLYRYAEPAAVQSRPDPGGAENPPRRATILFSGTSWQAAERARELLATDWNVSAETWSATSYKSLREDALEVERWNRLHPAETPRTPYVTRTLATASGPIVAVTDFMKAVPDQISRFVNVPFTPLGTDGFGRSDTRETLRRHFEVDAEHIVVAVLSLLATNGAAKQDEVSLAISTYGINPEAPDPRVA